MNTRFVATVFFLVMGYASFGQEKRSLNAEDDRANIVEAGLFKISVMYPYAEGKTFDMAYYETKHMPMVAKFLGSNLVKYTIEKGRSSGIPNQPLPYAAIGAFYVKSLDEYQAAISPHRDSIRADFVNYTDITPVILISEVIR